MADTRPCPGCKNRSNPGTQTRGEGILEQCGETHIKTTTWTCAACGQKDWDGAPNKPWSTNDVRDENGKPVFSQPRNNP